MENIPGQPELREVDPESQEYGDLHRSFSEQENERDHEFRKFIEENLAAKEWGRSSPYEAYFTDFHNAEAFVEIARDAGFETSIVESGRQEPKPFFLVRRKSESFGDFAASRGIRKKPVG